MICGESVSPRTSCSGRWCSEPMPTTELSGRTFTVRIPHRSSALTQGRAEAHDLAAPAQYADVPSLLQRESSAKHFNKVSTKLESEANVIQYWNSKPPPVTLGREFSSVSACSPLISSAQSTRHSMHTPILALPLTPT